MNYLPQRESVTPTIAEKVLTFLAPKLGNLVKQTLGWSNNSDIIPASGVHDHSNLSVQAMVYPGVQPVRRLPFPPDQLVCFKQALSGPPSVWTCRDEDVAWLLHQSGQPARSQPGQPSKTGQPSGEIPSGMDQFQRVYFL